MTSVTWSECSGHEWVDYVDHIAHGHDFMTPMYCKICDMPGERDERDGSMFFPTT